MQITRPAKFSIWILLIAGLSACGRKESPINTEELLWAYAGKYLLVSVEVGQDPSYKQTKGPRCLVFEVRKNWDQSHTMSGDWYNRHVDRTVVQNISELAFDATETPEGLIITESSTKRVWKIRKLDLSIESNQAQSTLNTLTPDQAPCEMVWIYTGKNTHVRIAVDHSVADASLGGAGVFVVEARMIGSPPNPMITDRFSRHTERWAIEGIPDVRFSAVEDADAIVIKELSTDRTWTIRKSDLSIALR